MIKSPWNCLLEKPRPTFQFRLSIETHLALPLPIKHLEHLAPLYTNPILSNIMTALSFPSRYHPRLLRYWQLHSCKVPLFTARNDGRKRLRLPCAAGKYQRHSWSGSCFNHPRVRYRGCVQGWLLGLPAMLCTGFSWIRTAGLRLYQTLKSNPGLLLPDCGS